MLTMKKYLIPIILFFCAFPVFGQTVADVLRYSNLQPSGTARFLGVGGAMGALGADYGAIAINPASLALYRTDELVVTPALHFSKVKASLPGGNVDKQSRSAFGFDNFGLVFNTLPRKSHWTTFNVAIGMNRLANFSQSAFYEGKGKGSVMNGFFKDAQQVLNNGGNEDGLYPFGSRLAWDANAIYLDQNQNLSYDFIDNPNATIDRSQTLLTYGRMNEMNISFAGNYEDKLAVGVTVGVPFVNYRIEGEYKESDPADSVTYFDGLTYTEYLRTEGVGFNAKLGLTYRVTHEFRLGVAFHTPTLLNLTDTYDNTFAYNFTDGDGSVVGDPVQSLEGRADYKLRTPWRAVASAALVVKKSGFISADLEWVDYTANNYNLDADVPNADNARFERELNNEIARAYKQAMNVRLGGELAIDQLRLRAGVNLIGKPYEGETGFNTAYTAGIGVRGESFYVDLGYRRYTGKGSIRPYSDAPVASTTVQNSDLLLTVGFKF